MISVVIPTLNEEENIFDLISALLNVQKRSKEPFEVIVVDDISEDNTVNEVMRAKALLSSKDFRINVIVNRRRVGLSGSVLKGMKIAKGSLIVVMDADFQHPPDVVRQLISCGKKCDICIGVRKEVRISPFRVFVYAVVRVLFTLSLMVRGAPTCSDPSSGFFVVKRELINSIDESKIIRSGWKILFDILKQLRSARVCEVGYSFNKRRAGTSKLRWQAIVSGLKSLLS